MLRFIMIFLILTLCLAVLTGEPKAAAPKATAARVECHGKLRLQQMAIGGEGTGSVIDFKGIKWELKLPNDGAREFANQHDKKPVTVIGTLRCVAGIERKARWIVDVTQLTARNPDETPDGFNITVEGMLQKDASGKGTPSKLAIAADGITWPLDISKNNDLQAKAESLISKTVVVSGKVDNLAERVYPLKLKLIPETLEIAPTKTARLR